MLEAYLQRNGGLLQSERPRGAREVAGSHDGDEGPHEVHIEIAVLAGHD